MHRGKATGEHSEKAIVSQLRTEGSEEMVMAVLAH